MLMTPAWTCLCATVLDRWAEQTFEQAISSWKLGYSKLRIAVTSISRTSHPQQPCQHCQRIQMTEEGHLTFCGHCNSPLLRVWLEEANIKFGQERACVPAYVLWYACRIVRTSMASKKSFKHLWQTYKLLVEHLLPVLCLSQCLPTWQHAV